MYDGFIYLPFGHVHREESDLDNDLSEESDKFRFLRALCFANSYHFRASFVRVVPHRF